MIDLETIDKVYLYPGSTDLRKGMNALSDLVGEEPKELYRKIKEYLNN